MKRTLWTSTLAVLLAFVAGAQPTPLSLEEGDVLEASNAVAEVNSVKSITWNGELLITGSRDGAVRLWEMASRKETARLWHQEERERPHNDLPPAVTSPSVRDVASQGARDVTWDIRHVAVSEDGRRLAAVDGASHVHIWALQRREEIAVLSADLAVWSGKRLATALAGGGNIEIFDADANFLLKLEHNWRISALAWSGDRLAAGLRDGRLFIWRDGVEGRFVPLGQRNDAIVNAMAWSPSGDLLASVSDDGKMRIWRVETRKEVFVSPIQTTPLRAISWHVGGYTVATGDARGKILLWEVSPIEPFKAGEIEGHEDSINALAFSPDGRWLASGSDDGTARIWDTTSTREVFRLKAPARRPSDPGPNDDEWISLETSPPIAIVDHSFAIELVGSRLSRDRTLEVVLRNTGQQASPPLRVTVRLPGYDDVPSPQTLESLGAVSDTNLSYILPVDLKLHSETPAKIFVESLRYPVQRWTFDRHIGGWPWRRTRLIVAGLLLIGFLALLENLHRLHTIRGVEEHNSDRSV